MLRDIENIYNDFCYCINQEDNGDFDEILWYFNDNIRDSYDEYCNEAL